MASINTYYLGQVDVPDIYVPVANLTYSNDGCGIFKYAISGDPSGFFHIKDDMLFLKTRAPYGRHDIDIHLTDPLDRFNSISTDYSLTISPFYCDDENKFYPYTAYNQCEHAFSGIECYTLYSQALDDIDVPTGQKPKLQAGMQMYTLDDTLMEYNKVTSDLDFYSHDGEDFYKLACMPLLSGVKIHVDTIAGVIQKVTPIQKSGCLNFCAIGSGLPTVIHFQSYVIPDKLEVFNICEDPLKENPIDVYGPSGTQVDPDLADNDPAGTYIAQYYVCPECLSYCVTADKAGTAWALTAFDSTGEPITIGNPVYSQAGGFLGGDAVCYEQDCLPPSNYAYSECLDEGECAGFPTHLREVRSYPSGTSFPDNVFSLERNWTSATTGDTYDWAEMFLNYDKYIVYQNESMSEREDVGAPDPAEWLAFRGQHQAVVCSGGVLFKINHLGNNNGGVIDGWRNNTLRDYLEFDLTTDNGTCDGWSPTFPGIFHVPTETTVSNWNPIQGSFQFYASLIPDEDSLYCANSQPRTSFYYNIQFLDYFKFPDNLY